MHTIKESIQRNFYLAMAVLLTATAILPSLIISSTADAALVTARKITMSSAEPSTASVSYEVSFTAGSSYDLDGIVVQFCDDSPIIGSTSCTGTAGTEVPNTSSVGSSVTVTGAPNGTWTAAVSETSGGQQNKGVEITNAGGTNNVTNATNISFTLTGITNPSSTGTFYARIYTYNSATNATNATVATLGSYNDYGGIALSTTDDIDVSATVQESLTFCVAATSPGDGCSTTDTPDVVLGTGTPVILDTSAVYTDTITFQTSTNATSGVAVNMKGSSTNLTSGSNTIPAISTSALTAITAGSGTWGARIADSTGGTGTVGGDAAWEHASNYIMHSDITGTYGDTIASSAGAVLNAENVLTFGASASPTTVAGIYTAALSLIATGTY